MSGNPYTLPDGNVQIAFSGGRTSAYMLHQILEANGDLPERARVVFANTGREMPGTLDFVQECGERWGVRIEWVQYLPVKPWFETVSHNSAARDGEPFEAMIRHKRYVPNGRKRICTEQLKVRSSRRMLVASGWRRWSKALGIRVDEPQRHDQPDQPRESIWLPLVAANVRRSDVLNFWRSQPFDLSAGTVSNCRLCFQFDRMKLGRQMIADPQDDWPERMEAIGHGTFIDGKPWAERCAGRGAWPDNTRAATDARPTDGFWRDADWLGCRDGKWRPVEPGTFPLADGLPAGMVRMRAGNIAHRAGALKAFGNAIVPQVAASFIRMTGGHR